MPTRSWIFAASLALAVLFHAGDTLAKQIFYKGYTIEAGEGADSSPDWNTMVARLYGQIDIMEGVGLPARVSDFFKSRPLEVDRSLRGAGEYIDGRLVINPTLVDNIHPVALGIIRLTYQAPRYRIAS